MIPEQVFPQILALGEAWQVTRVDYVEAGRKVTIRVEETPQVWASLECPHCGRRHVCGYDPAPERRWRHPNVCPLESEIVCALPRGQCRDCQKVFTGRAPWEGRSPRCPQAFEAFALTLMREMPVAKAGEILGETAPKLWRRLFAPVDGAWAGVSWENVVWVGADEMNRRKGHNYLTVFVDWEAKRVLLAVEGKDARVGERFAAELGRHNGPPKAIPRVAIDMSPAYVKGGKANFGNAVIVFAKFHVVSQVAAAVDEVRRAESRQGADARVQWEKTCWLWRKNPAGWTEREAWRGEPLKDKPLVPGLASARRLEWQRAYAAGTARVARRRFVQGCQWVRAAAAALTSGLREPLRQAADRVERHLEGILGHGQPGLTTAFPEGLNSLFSATKRKARGHRSTAYQTAMRYFVAGKLEIPYYG